MSDIENEDGDFFPSINQYRSVVKSERDWAAYHNVPPRRRWFIGTVKLHGTNAGISLTKDGDILYRSRTRVITPDDDNYGFARHMSAHETVIRDILSAYLCEVDMVTMFGEWCGAGVQGNVGIAAEQKMFVVFAIKVGNDWVEPEGFHSTDARIFNIHSFPTWKMEIDFDKPEQHQNDLVEITERVEKECPVAKQFGHSGIGEGVVWRPMGEPFDSRYWFKVKGEKHSSSKVKVLAAVDAERFKKRDDLVDALVTENRLKQGIDLHVNEFGHELSMRTIADYLRWVFNDVIKEESDTISVSGFEIKELGKSISDKAKRFYKEAVERSPIP